jgi:GNAT superfamily N-acetyltransferase
MVTSPTVSCEGDAVEVRALRHDEVGAVGAVLGLARLFQGDGTYLVAWDGDTVVGHAHLTRGRPPELQDVEVRSTHRRRGVATLLLDAAAATCRARGDASLRVEVSVDNPGARALYERAGFRDTGEPTRRVVGVVQLRTGPLEVDDTLCSLVKPLAAT